MSTRLCSVLVVGVCLGTGCDGETGFTKTEDIGFVEQGTAEIVVTPEAVRIEDIDWEGQIAKSQQVVIENVGDGVLYVHEVALIDNGGGAFYIEELGELELAPGAARDFALLATLTEPEPVQGALRIQSGDVDESNLVIEVLALPLGYEPPDDTGDTGD